MKRTLRIVLSGATGRMGRAVAAAAAADGGVRVLGGVGRAEAGRLPGLLAAADAVIDFSLPAPALAAARACARARVPFVCGTTGFEPRQLAALKSLSRRTPVFWAPNMSLGMGVLADLAARAARALPGYQAAVIDVHHAAKRDAPSGSAKRLQAALGGAPAVSLRVGDVVGDHTVVIAGPGERLELVHRAHSREVFARGALAAARWLKGRRAGFYGMPDLTAR